MSETTPLYKLSADTVRNDDGELAVIIYGDQGAPDVILCDGLVYRPERACHAIFNDSTWYSWECSECGQPINRADNYCFSCGAKVVDNNEG